MKTRRQQLAARCCGFKPNECRDQSRLASKNAPGLTVRPDGKRTHLNETAWLDLNEDGERTANELKANSFSWQYDDLNRLTDEVIDHWDDAFDQTEGFQYDLSGNRTRLDRDKGNDGTIDEAITYSYDANDRLLDEVLDSIVDTDDTTTSYTYNHTQQTAKQVFTGTESS